MKKVDVSLKEAQATFELKPGKELQPEILRKAVVDAGFTPRDIFLTVRGMLKEGKSKFVFQPMGSGQVFSLIESEDLVKLKGDGLKEIDLVAKVIGDRPPLTLEIQKYRR